MKKEKTNKQQKQLCKLWQLDMSFTLFNAVSESTSDAFFQGISALSRESKKLLLVRGELVDVTVVT